MCPTRRPRQVEVKTSSHLKHYVESELFHLAVRTGFCWTVLRSQSVFSQTVSGCLCQRRYQKLYFFWWYTCQVNGSLELLYHFVGYGIPFSCLSVRRFPIPLPKQDLETSSVLARISSRKYSLTFPAFEIQFSSFFLFDHSMSMNLDMKMVQSLNSSGLMFFLAKSFRIS